MNSQKLSQLIDEGRSFAFELPPSANRHISMIFDGPRMISVGANYGKTATAALKLGYYNMVPHSELRAFLKVPYTRRSNLTLVNLRFNKNGELRMSRPCVRCENWCFSVFKHIYYSTEEGMVYLNRRNLS